jgi:hypothetical protein
MKSKREAKSMNVTSKSEFYNIPREFDKKPTSQAFTFGISRKFYNKVYIEKAKIYEKDNPGPGSYNYLKEFGSDAPKYTKYLQTTTSSRRQNEEKILGPGEYDMNKIDINREGKYTLSKYKNTTSLNFGLINKSVSRKPFQSNYQLTQVLYLDLENMNHQGFLMEKDFFMIANTNLPWENHLE